MRRKKEGIFNEYCATFLQKELFEKEQEGQQGKPSEGIKQREH